MADGVFSLKGIFTTAALALAIDLLFVFPISHFSAWGKGVTSAMAEFYGFIPSASAYTAASTAAASATGAVVSTPAGLLL